MATKRDKRKVAEGASSIQVLDRAARLLETIAQAKKAPNLKVLALDTGLHVSTAFRILASLQQHGLVERDGEGAYRLGPTFLRYGGRVRLDTDLRALARPEMERLRSEVAETVNLTVRENDEVVYIERVTPNRMMRVEQVIGSRAPLHVTAVGKLMLGGDGEQACLRYAQRSGLRRYTPNTITDPAQLARMTGEAAERGFAYDNEEAELGVGCLGVLIRDAAGETVAGLSISAPLERRRDEWIVPLREAALRISRRLGYSGE